MGRASFANYKIIIGLLLGSTVLRHGAGVVGLQSSARQQMSIEGELVGMSDGMATGSVGSLSDDIYLMTGEKMAAKSQTEARQQQQLSEFMKMSNQEKQQIVTQLKAQSNSNVDVAEQSQWGFLKNIINIDKFFDSGADATGSKGGKSADGADSSISEVQKNVESKKVNTGQSLVKKTEEEKDKANNEVSKKEEAPKEQPKPKAEEVD